MVPIGTSVKAVLDFSDNTDPDGESVIIGGPMMGTSAANLNAVIEKRTNAVLVMKPKASKQTTNCIHCQRCAGVCPMSLYPAQVEAALRSDHKEMLDQLYVGYCIECGCCSYICPAARPLTQSMRTAKAELRRNKK